MNFSSDYSMTIGGQSVVGDETFSVINPATEEEIGRAPDCSRAQLDQAVAAARTAFPAWRATPFAERKQYVAAIGAKIAEHADELKMLLTREQGKPHKDAAGDVLGGAYWCHAISTLDLPVTIAEDSADRRTEIRHVPLGVVGAIAPWNFPIILAMFKVAPALLAGNCVVLKPSPFTPLTTLKLGELLREVLPAGVLNVISGGDQLGPWLTSHAGVDKISFTGSTQTGRKVMASASETLKRVTLELGGNDAAIILPDVDVAAMAEDIFWAAFRNSGQVCVATKRMYVHADVYDSLKDAIVAYASTISVGDGSKQGVQLGPIQNAAQYARVLELIADSKAQGHHFLMGGDVWDQPGYFVPVTILDNPPEDARIVQEEQFGPVLPLIKVDSVEDAIRRANASEYGLGASVWSSDEDKARAVGDQLDAGTVWINEAGHIAPLVPFGGHKQSGIGREGGIAGLTEYTNSQVIFVKKRAAA